MQNFLRGLWVVSNISKPQSMSKGYAIYLAKDNRNLNVVEFPIQQYAQWQRLMRFINERNGGTVTSAELKAAGFEDITKDLRYPTSTNGGRGCVEMLDDAQIELNNKGIQTIFERIDSYNNQKASLGIKMERLACIDYNETWHNNSLKSIKRCIEHFYQLQKKLRDAFADVPGIVFEISEEEVQYANLYFRVLYKGRLFLQLLGQFGKATFIHIINSKYRIPLWEITINPFKESCQLHNAFKDIHNEEATNEEVLQLVTASYNGCFDKYLVVSNHIHEIFSIELIENDFEYDLVRECVVLHEEAERKIIVKLLPKPVGEDVTEFYKYTTLDTLIKILQNGTIRMNSIVAMNDTSETNILQDAIRNFKEPIESEADNYLESNTRFITSFTALEDTLPMWSQYGNKGTGVCLVFERGPLFKDSDLLYIKYISKDDETVKKIEKLQGMLKLEDVNFYFALLDKYRNFIKYDFYDKEEEYRYLVIQDKEEGWTINREYNIVVPYIDKSIPIGSVNQKSAQKYNFPFILRRAILGPAMPNQKYNVWQLNYFASRKNIWNFKVTPSKIDNFR